MPSTTACFSSRHWAVTPTVLDSPRSSRLPCCGRGSNLTSISSADRARLFIVFNVSMNKLWYDYARFAVRRVSYCKIPKFDNQNQRAESKHDLFKPFKRILRSSHRGQLAGRLDPGAAVLQRLLQPRLRAGQDHPGALPGAGHGGRVDRQMAGRARPESRSARSGNVAHAVDAAHAVVRRHLPHRFAALGRAARQHLRLVSAPAGPVLDAVVHRDLLDDRDEPCGGASSWIALSPWW